MGVDFFMAKTAQEIRLNSREDLWAFKDILLIQKNRAVFLITMGFFGISKIIIIFRRFGIPLNSSLQLHRKDGQRTDRSTLPSVNDPVICTEERYSSATLQMEAG